MEFHISRALRESLDLDDLLFQFTGNVIFGSVSSSRKLARRLNELRSGETAEASVVHAGALFAMGLIDELSHAMIARYREETDPTVMAEALRWFGEQIGRKQTEALLLRFSNDFPSVAVFRGDLTPAKWLEGKSDGIAHREAAFEELLLLWLANQNPAFTPFKELFDDRPLGESTVYPIATESFEPFFQTRPAWSPELGTLLDVLRAPMLASPDSLAGQLDFIREKWAPHLGEEVRRALLAIDTLREEDLAIWMQFHPPAAGRHGHGGAGGQGWDPESFDGDEYVGFDGVRRSRRQYSTDHQAPLNEYEAFSEDQAWMPTVVLMAKSTYVWLEQLSKKYGRHIHRLDQIPEEELRLMASRGMTGLWLIGLWERSIASRTIKRLRGQEDAVASAYSLKDYQIAEDLGGPSAYESLRDRAATAGIRLASDMVPNHMGIDSNWVVDHPDWFISRPESPFPAYSFEGPDLSTDGRVEIKIDDHYFDQTDAAVVFRLRQRGSGEARFVYHGNDGTTFAWNDTAQLDYSKAYVREQVIQAILHVARLFPIIRFDAAMTLAKRHVQRLWFPLPGVGGSIPSRAESAMTQEEFDAVMPHEFWREVVDRVAAEVPGTLLLAEAFWMLEGYFVRTLGMHRVYNSAFMNMLRDEENAKYRSYLKKTVEFDPDILKRYVNFMSNPDERTTIDQFGSGDKCFGVATLMSTLPGLPMFGHGQIEGFTERYGMEYKRARMDETPSESLTGRHQREIAPLLKRRHVFAESANFVLYDFWTDGGTVDENVFAYSNRAADERAIILYNNAYNSTRGTIHTSAASMDKVTGQLRQRALSEAVGLPSEEAVIIAYRDAAQGLSFLRRSRDFDHQGFTADLRGYQYMVLESWRVLHSSAEQPWDQLCDALGGAGVHNLDEALSKLRLRPLHERLRQVLSRANIESVLAVAQGQVTLPQIERKAKAQSGARARTVPASARAAGASEPDPRLDGFLKAAEHFLALLKENSGGDLESAVIAEPGAPRVPLQGLLRAALRLPVLEQSFSSAWPNSVRSLLPTSGAGGSALGVWAPVLAAVVLQAAEARIDEATFDALQLRSALAEIFSALELHGDDAWRAAARVRLLLSPSAALPATLLSRPDFWQGGDVLWLAGISEAHGVQYLNKERFEDLLSWMQLPSLMELAESPTATGSKVLQPVEDVVSRGIRTAATAGYDLRRFTELWTARTSVSPSAVTVEPKLVVSLASASPAPTMPSRAAKSSLSKNAVSRNGKNGSVLTPPTVLEPAAPLSPGTKGSASEKASSPKKPGKSAVKAPTRKKK